MSGLQLLCISAGRNRGGISRAATPARTDQSFIRQGAWIQTDEPKFPGH